jgi:hypothetical protein
MRVLLRLDAWQRNWAPEGRELTSGAWSFVRKPGTDMDGNGEDDVCVLAPERHRRRRTPAGACAVGEPRSDRRRRGWGRHAET